MIEKIKPFLPGRTSNAWACGMGGLAVLLLGNMIYFTGDKTGAKAGDESLWQVLPWLVGGGAAFGLLEYFVYGRSERRDCQLMAQERESVEKIILSIENVAEMKRLYLDEDEHVLKDKKGSEYKSANFVGQQMVDIPHSSVNRSHLEDVFRDIASYKEKVHANAFSFSPFQPVHDDIVFNVSYYRLEEH